MSSIEQIGDCLLYLADAAYMLPEMKAASVDMIFADPPYGHNNNDGDLIHNREKALGVSQDVASGRPIANDSPDDAAALVALLFSQAPRLLAKGAAAVAAAAAAVLIRSLRVGRCKWARALISSKWWYGTKDRWVWGGTIAAHTKRCSSGRSAAERVNGTQRVTISRT